MLLNKVLRFPPPHPLSPRQQDLSSSSSMNDLISTPQTQTDDVISVLVLFVLTFYGPVNPMGSCPAWFLFFSYSVLLKDFVCVEVLRPQFT